MSRQNVELVRAIYARLGGQDLAAAFRSDPGAIRDALPAAYSPDLEVSWVATNPDAGLYRGHDGYMQALADWLEAWDEFYVEPQDFIDAGEHVIVPTVQRGIGTSGIEVEESATFAYTVYEGKVVRIREYETTEHALQAAERE